MIRSNSYCAILFINSATMLKLHENLKDIKFGSRKGTWFFRTGLNIHFIKGVRPVKILKLYYDKE